MSVDFKGAHVGAEEKNTTNEHKLQKKTPPGLMKNLKENEEMLLFLLLFLNLIEILFSKFQL